MNSALIKTKERNWHVKVFAPLNLNLIMLLFQPIAIGVYGVVCIYAYG